MLRRNHQTNVLSFTWLTVIVAVEFGFGFELKCPEPSHRAFRKHMCGTPEKYSCLYDIKRNIYVESCVENIDFVKAGKRYVIWGGRDSYDCSDSRYQPRKFWSNVTSDCEMLKSTCCEQGQIAVSDGSTKEDRACRCDTLNGFSFITTHIDVCACIPSQEDCNCYRTKLTEGKIQAEAFNCVKSTVTGKCSSVGELEVKLNESTLSTGTSTTVYTLDNKGFQREKIHRHGHIVHINIVLLIGCIVLMFACAVAILTFGLDEKLDFKIMVLRDGEINRALKEKDSFQNKIISNWKDLKSRMDCTDVENQLSKYKFMDARSLRKQRLWKKYPKDCLLKFIAERSFEIVDNIRWYNVRKDIFFHILQLPLVKPKDKVLHQKDQQKQELHLYSKQLTLLKYIQIESDDIIDDFIESFVFDLTDMEEIREKLTSSEMDNRFLEIVKKTLEKGSYRLWLDIVKENKTRSPQILNILEELKYDQAANMEVKLMNGKMHNGNTDKVRDVLLDVKLANSGTKKLKQMDIQKQGVIACANSFMEVLGSFPLDDTRPGIYLTVVCSKILERIENNIARGTFYDLVKELCIQLKVETGSYIFDIALTVAEEDESALHKDSDEQPTNIIQAIRSFLVEEMDTEIIAEGLCHEMNEEYKTKLKEQHNRIQKAEIICDFLQENSKRILPILLIILDDNDMKVVSERLQSYQTIKDTDHLRNAMTMHFQRIVTSLYSNCLLDGVVDILKKRNIFKTKRVNENLTKEPSEVFIGKYLVYLMKEGRNAMLHFIDALYSVGEKDLSQTLLLNGICDRTEENIEIENILQKVQLIDGILFNAQFRVTLHEDKKDDIWTDV